MQLSRRGFIAVTLSAAATPALAMDPPVFTGSRFGLGRDIAIRGYDPVEYLRGNGPVKGERDFETEWNGATWRFASAENRDLFASDPEAHAPQYGGYCAWAVANGYTASTDPDAWSLHDGKLYLNYSLGVRDTWSRDIPGNIARGDANWPDVLN